MLLIVDMKCGMIDKSSDEKMVSDGWALMDDGLQ